MALFMNQLKNWHKDCLTILYGMMLASNYVPFCNKSQQNESNYLVLNEKGLKV